MAGNINLAAALLTFYVFLTSTYEILDSKVVTLNKMSYVAWNAQGFVDCYEQYFLKKLFRKWILVIMFGARGADGQVASNISKVKRHAPNSVTKRRRKWPNTKVNKTFLFINVLLLLIGGDVNPNPGPVKYPCGLCSKAVRSNQDGLCCDGCDKWHHLKCLPDAISLTKEEYLDLAQNSTRNWYCYKCQTPDLNDSFFSANSDDQNLSSKDASVLELSFSHIQDYIVQSPDSDTRTHVTEVNDNKELFDTLKHTRLKYKKNFLISHLNINSLRNKYEELKEILTERLSDVLVVSETKLDSSFPNAQFQCSQYISYRRDRTARGGGIIAYVRADLPTREIHDIQLCESIALEISGKEKFFLLCLYNPPSTKDSIFQEQFTKALDLAYTRYKKIIVVGDLNYNLNDQEKGKVLMDLCDVFNLHNLIKNPTCHSRHGDSLIDVILTNVPKSIQTCGNFDCALSDLHDLIYCVMKKHKANRQV